LDILMEEGATDIGLVPDDLRMQVGLMLPALGISMLQGSNNGIGDNNATLYWASVASEAIYEIELSEPEDLQVEITNTGNRPTGELTVALSGEDYDSFTLSETSIENIAVDGTATFTVIPNTDLEVRVHNATVNISGENGISETLNVSFTVTEVEALEILVEMDENGVRGDYVDLVISVPVNPGVVAMTLYISYDSDVLERVIRYNAVFEAYEVAIIVGDVLPVVAAPGALGVSPITIPFLDLGGVMGTTPPLTATGMLVTVPFRIANDAPNGATTVAVTASSTQTVGSVAVPVEFVDDGTAVLVVEIDRSELQAAIEEALELEDYEEYFTVESWEVFEEALAEAQRVFADTDATQEEIDEATEALLEAMSDLESVAFIWGDVNGDGEIDILDLILLRRYLADHPVDVAPGADVNGDGEIDILDLILLRRYLADHPVTLGP